MKKKNFIQPSCIHLRPSIVVYLLQAADRLDLLLASGRQHVNLEDWWYFIFYTKRLTIN